MHLNDEEQAMAAGAFGPARQWAIRHQATIGEFFDAPDLVAVAQALIMADTESLGEAGITWLADLATAPRDERRVRIPTITDPRGVDPATYRRLKQTDRMAELEARAAGALEALGVLLTNTCINYQSVFPPVRGEHLAMGDTGVAIYCNSVIGARSNFEGGPSALAAGLTGRTPRYGYHLDEHRAGSRLFVVSHQPTDLADWGALGGIIGRATSSYWEVPVIDGLRATPSSDALKHFGAALASFGSVALFHIPGVTAEAASLAAAFGGRPLPPSVAVTEREFRAFYADFAPGGDKVDVVVFAAPHLSLFEMRQVADLLAGRRVHEKTALVVATSPEIKHAADRLGISRRIEDAGGIIASGICFYQSYARELAEANGWRLLLTNSAKLVNIIAGYGYEPALAGMQRCVDSAVKGRLV
jgi:predicted aconitase